MQSHIYKAPSSLLSLSLPLSLSLVHMHEEYKSLSSDVELDDSLPIRKNETVSYDLILPN